jgi:uncharacterized membrane protein YagU involved in acid resistance
MKVSAALVIFSIVLATVYGVLFSIVYPRVAINGSILATLAFAGLVTSLVLVGLWAVIRRK